MVILNFLLQIIKLLLLYLVIIVLKQLGTQISLTK
jgi:hypothetical protein